jgi:protein gp37
VIRLVPEVLDEPLRWRKPRRVFVNSMSDLFHEDVPFAFIDDVFFTMANARQHTFQILTKRGRRMREFMQWSGNNVDPLPNVWLGVSVENQRAADERIQELLATPAAVRFLSCEPLLGPVNVRGHLLSHDRPGDCAACGDGHGFTRCPNTGGIAPTCERTDCTTFRRVPNAGIGWVIAGGESGRGARPCSVDWIRSLVEQCRGASVPAFVKQLGAAWAHEHPSYPFNDAKGGEPDEWPEDLRVREFPEVSRG